MAEYHARKDEIIANKKVMYLGEDFLELQEIGDLEDLNMEDLDVIKPEHIGNTLCSQVEQNNAEDNADGYIDDPEFESLGYIGNLDLNQEESREQVADYKYKRICLPDNEEMKYMTRKLVPEQMNILRTVVASCKDIVRARKNPKVRPKPIRLIVHGGAGNDKHFLLEIS